jgi:peptidoglycan/LPS O-acetylase OafA/YrhL
VALAVAMYHGVEQPCRRWMQRLVAPKRVRFSAPVAEASKATRVT